MKLIERLIEEGDTDFGCRIRVTLKSFENVVRLKGKHFPSYVESGLSRKNKRVRKCVVCSLKKTIMDNAFEEKHDLNAKTLYSSVFRKISYCDIL
ncbi:hypothetical protein NPIL_578831 [Nephila pilipes]|uniref:Uncharacterized protein n=1 Tax=Nephila pilipes TaxID=299642 RepID=A0A8X6UIM6_NEPPI|nr:hypothetical protein NPIL_578831 [Nephila pilipes]